MAIGKGSMARAAKTVKAEVKTEVAVETKATDSEQVVNAEAEVPEVKQPVKSEKKEEAKKTVTKKSTPKKVVTTKKAPVKKTATSVITPDKQVVDMITSEERCEVGQEMPIYLL